MFMTQILTTGIIIKCVSNSFIAAGSDEHSSSHICHICCVLIFNNSMRTKASRLSHKSLTMLIQHYQHLTPDLYNSLQATDCSAESKAYHQSKEIMSKLGNNLKSFTFQLIIRHSCHSRGTQLLQDQSLCLLRKIKTPQCVFKNLT